MEYSGFFNGDQEYGQEEFNRYFDNIYRSGIGISDNGNMDFNISIANKSVSISQGFAIVKGFYLYSDSVKTINIISDANYDRIDRIVVRLNLSTSKVSLEHKLGVAGSKPKAPDITRDNLIYELSLAQVFVPRTGAVNLTDERAKNDLCGAIRPKNLNELDTMLKSMQKDFDEWFNSQQSKGWRNMFIQPDTPQGSVNGSIWIKTYQ